MRHPIGRERRVRGRQIARQPDGDFAFDADTDEILGAQRHAAVVNAFGEHAATAGMWNIKISLHHRAGAADFVTHPRAEIGRQQAVQRVLNPVSLGFISRRGIASQRRQWRPVAAGGGDGLCSRERVVHLRHSKNTNQNSTIGPRVAA